jgi:hypothetical protein
MILSVPGHITFSRAATHSRSTWSDRYLYRNVACAMEDAIALFCFCFYILLIRIARSITSMILNVVERLQDKCPDPKYIHIRSLKFTHAFESLAREMYIFAHSTATLAI